MQYPWRKVLVCLLIAVALAGCAVVGPTSGQTSEKDPPATTPTVVLTTGGTAPAGTLPTPTEPENDLVRYWITVEKKCNTAFADDETLVLGYGAKGELLEYRMGIWKRLYTYDDRGNMLSQKTYTRGGELIGQTDYAYDEQGRLVQTEGFGYAEVYTTYRTEYVYDDDGNLIREKNYQNGELFTEEIFDAAGNLLEGFSYMGGGYDSHSVYTYDDGGNLLRVETELGGAPYSGWAYFYDEDGRLIREERFRLSDGKRKELTNTYTYDENGRCIRYDMGGFQGEQSYETYTYDAAGNMLSSVYHHYDGNNTAYYWTYDEDGRITSWKSENRHGTTTYTWEYDAQGNACKLTQNTAGMDFTYSFSYTWPEAELPQAAWEEIFIRIAAFTDLSVYTPEIYARIYD